MSLGNDPERVPDREPEPRECRHCDRKTVSASRVCPDCHFELSRGPTRGFLP
jgi:hypothetical protein